MRVAQRVGQSREFGQRLQAVQRPADDVHGVVAEREERDAVRGVGRERQGDLDRAEDLVGGV